MADAKHYECSLPGLTYPGSTCSLRHCIRIKIETVTFSDVFLGQENGNIRIAMDSVYCGFVTLESNHLTGCARDRASENDIARILRGVEVAVCFSFRYLIFILCLPSIIKCVRLD